MTKVEDRCRQAYELNEDGYSIGEIARAMGKPTSAVERWIRQWVKIRQASEAPQPWHAGLDHFTVARLRRAGITSQEELLQAWENGEIQPGTPRGIGLLRMSEIHRWLTSMDSDIRPPPTKPVIFELSAEAREALDYFKRWRGEEGSELVSRLLVEAKARGIRLTCMDDSRSTLTRALCFRPSDWRSIF